MMLNLRERCLVLLALKCPVEKAVGVLALELENPFGPDAQFSELPDLPGRGVLPDLVPHREIKAYPLSSKVGHAALVHSIVHIEKNAIDLALDICWRFSGLPIQFYADWLKVAQEEAQHFLLLRGHLLTLGFDYGDFSAHNGLWEMAERTRYDVLARVALVPRTLEARGLDASPAVKAKLVSIGDEKGGQILDIILKDEINHVAIGNKWYQWFCVQQGLDPVSTYAQLCKKFSAPKLKGPFNLEARRAAGFKEEELAALV